MGLIRDIVRTFARSWAAAALVGVLAVAMPQTASAEDAAASGTDRTEKIANELVPLTTQQRDALVGRLTDEQARDLLLFYLGQSAPAAQQTDGSTAAKLSVEAVQTRISSLRQNLEAVLSRFDDLISEYAGRMQEKLSLTVGAGGLWFILRYLLLFAAVGAAVEYVYRYLTRRIVETNEAAPAETEREKLARAGTQLLHGLGAILAFAAGYVGIFLSLYGGDLARRNFVVVVLLAILITRVSVAVTRFIFLPRHPRWRIMPVDDEAAAHFVRGTRRQLTLGTTLLLLSTLGLMWGVNHDVWRLWALISAIVFTISACVFIARYRQHLLRAIDSAIADRSVPRWAESAAGWGWFALAFAYVVIAFLIGTYNLLLGHPFEPIKAVLGFFILFVLEPYVTAVATGILAPDRPVSVESEPVVYVTDPDDGEQIRTTLEGQAAEAARQEAAIEAAIESSPAVMRDQRVLKRVISLAVLVLALAAFATVIGVNAYSTAQEYPIAQFALRLLLDIGLVALLGYVSWVFIASWIDRKLAEERAKSPEAEQVEEGPAMQGGTRLQTILPIVRKFVQISIAVVAVMMVLASMGVNIGPLIAGAGVIGLAVGFGSQTLVKDVISGMFFLMDDAFRIGEYIESGDVAGTVEKFNTRSLVLRGYLGAVYTVPYGSLGKVTNYSRDWVIMKLRFRVPYDTDIDLVRKIFKKIGQEMMEDPELGPNFLQPFKSQGVIKMDDSAFIVSGKFMTKPNKQWGVRKAVYEKVQQAFKEYGIKFAPKRVIVDVPNAADMEDEEVDEKAAARKPVDRPSAAAAAVAAEGS